ncbi:hypothetical protein [Pseudonocardia sp. TMWB2A]|uniref:hypothetical protein n=1 Tax=Pseudonocardia sp. TMWB2A TaxID=687430 RepID=UPI00307EF69D
MTGTAPIRFSDNKATTSETFWSPVTEMTVPSRVAKIAFIVIAGPSFCAAACLDAGWAEIVTQIFATAKGLALRLCEAQDNRYYDQTFPT